MSPATTLASTPDTAPPSLWARLEQVVQHDNEKTSLLKEIMIRYDYLTQEYQRECEERAREHDAILAWQRDKKLFEENYKTMQIAMASNPFVMILIDGDGMIFEDEFIRDGEQGGRRAASQIHAAVVEFVQRETNDIPLDVRIICRVYANVRGLAEVLVRVGAVQEVGIVEEFVRGFTRGKTLFDFVDVGPGKDRADEKLIETFKLCAADMHCRQIFFGCSHDNGYARTLEDHSSDTSYLNRITLLQGVPFEKELLALPYKTKRFPGIFRESKIQVWGAPGAIPPGTNGINGYNSPVGIGFNGCKAPLVAKNYNIINGLPSRFPPPVRTTSATLLLDSPIQAPVAPRLPRTPSSSSFASNDGFNPLPAKPAVMNYAAKAALPAPPVTEAPAYKPANREEVIARNRGGQRVDPPCRDYDKTEVDRIKKIKMCNVHFLRDECPYGPACTHLHSYKPTKDEISTLRLVARMAPCQNGSGCQDIKCMYGHRCPAPRSDRGAKGTKSCIFGEQCKFPPELHDIDCTVVKTLVIR
ncbi:hypothetical protein K505DRAFT_143878 [Melanomma pulvis-pyrius CBS 109.77]|uniref:C3H1-type domain-containing protein n=1 Tax=Melanomma pulvis-pyrius CBS 109.77 TaxID=1314802 RepID=A0A6A6XLF9_9PLEO|nr:hypothetical protein K505DRAFT_143878 [Melanomma pulvis-pyrius CBS 109.77]